MKEEMAEKNENRYSEEHNEKDDEDDDDDEEDEDEEEEEEWEADDVFLMLAFRRQIELETGIVLTQDQTEEKWKNESKEKRVAFREIMKAKKQKDAPVFQVLNIFFVFVSA